MFNKNDNKNSNNNNNKKEERKKKEPNGNRKEIDTSLKTERAFCLSAPALSFGSLNVPFKLFCVNWGSADGYTHTHERTHARTKQSVLMTAIN